MGGIPGIVGVNIASGSALAKVGVKEDRDRVLANLMYLLRENHAMWGQCMEDRTFWSFLKFGIH
jgi:hypothetical protein